MREPWHGPSDPVVADAVASETAPLHAPLGSGRRTRRLALARDDGGDVLDHYLRDIARYPLLSRAEEADLARRIRAGDEEALDTLVRANLRFVVSFAKRYRHHGVPLADVISDGNLGLLRAARKFDATKGVKFISYAVWWIKQAILHGLAAQSRLVRVPLNRAGTLYRIGRRATALRQALGREATHAELAAALELAEAEVATTLAAALRPVSLDAPLPSGDGERPGDRLLDHLAVTRDAAPDEQVAATALTELIEASLAGLNARESRILRLYFGLDGEEPLTLDQIGARLGITRERVRQLKERALTRLRTGRAAAALADFH